MVVFAWAPDSRQLSGLWGSYQRAKPDALSLGSWLHTVPLLPLPTQTVRWAPNADTPLEPHCVSSLFCFFFFFLFFFFCNNAGEKKRRLQVSSVHHCVPDIIRSMAPGRAPTPAMASAFFVVVVVVVVVIFFILTTFILTIKKCSADTCKNEDVTFSLLMHFHCIHCY